MLQPTKELDCLCDFDAVRRGAAWAQSNVEAEFLKITPADAEDRAKLAKAVAVKVNNPEFQAQMQTARQAVQRAK